MINVRHKVFSVVFTLPRAIKIMDARGPHFQSSVFSKHLSHVIILTVNRQFSVFLCLKYTFSTEYSKGNIEKVLYI